MSRSRSVLEYNTLSLLKLQPPFWGFFLKKRMSLLSKAFCPITLCTGSVFHLAPVKF